MNYKKMLSFLVAITMIVATFSTFSKVEAQEDGKGVVLNKTATMVDARKVEITLESYASATTSGTNSYPNFILNLDTSPSMDELVDTDGDGVADSSKIEVLRDGVQGLLDLLHNSAQPVKVSIVTFADVASTGIWYIDPNEAVATPHMAAWNDSDINKIMTQGKYIVEFDMNDDADYEYASKIISGDIANPDDGLQTVVGGLSRVDKGFDVVYRLLHNRLQSESAVITYTDGVPRQSSNDTGSNLKNPTYKSAASVKGEYGSVVYAIGVTNPDEDPNLAAEDTLNWFINSISSNSPLDEGYEYLDQSSEEFIRDYSFLLNDNSGYQTSMNETMDQITGDPNFQQALFAVLDEVYQNEVVNRVSLSGAAEIRDHLVAQLETPEVAGFNETNGKGNGVFIYTQDYLGLDENDNDLFGPMELVVSAPSDQDDIDLDDLVLTIDPIDKIVSVTGFDFAANSCYLDSQNIAHGKKMVIVITTDFIDGFIGGNLVYTNESDSGLYDDDGLLYDLFNRPTVDVSLLYQIEPVDKYVYITNSACNLQSLADIVSSTGYYYQNDDDSIKFTFGDFRNSYVNITYEFFNEANVSLGVLTILAGEATFNGTLGNLQGLLDDENLTVKVTINPIYDAAIYGATYAPISFDIMPKVLVVDPTINLQDSTNFLGETPDYDDFVDSVYWPSIGTGDYIGCDGTNPLSATTGMPNLLITPVDDTPERVAFNGDYDVIGTPIIGHAHVVADLPTAVDITSRAMYRNEDSSSDLNEFNLTIVDGEFTIEKTSTDYSNLNPIESNQGFKFMIEQFAGANLGDEVGAKVRTFYVTLDNGEATKTIKYLEEGFYRVTEVDAWSDKYETQPSQEFFVGRDGVADEAIFYYANNWYDENGTGIVDDMKNDDIRQFDFTTKTFAQYPWIGDVAVARNHVTNAE